MRHPVTTVPRRNIPLLAAFAIFGVVFNHATWDVLENFVAGDPRGYIYLPLEQIGKFAIPVFMFIAGYFSAYATSGGRKPLEWRVVHARVTKLLWPWLLWSLIWLTAQIVAQSLGMRSGEPLGFNLSSLVMALFAQYYFIPMLITYYLLSPALVEAGRRNPRRLLTGAGILQLAGIGIFYVQVYFPHTLPPLLRSGEWPDVTLLQYLRFAIYFPLGLLVGMKPAAFAPLLRWRKALPWLTALAFALAVTEGSLAYRTLTAHWQRGDSHVKITSMLFSLGLIFCFMVYPHIPVPSRWKKLVHNLSTNTYGLYLSHYVVLAGVSRLTSRLLPPTPAAQIPYIFALAVATLSICLWIIRFSTRSRPIHDALFG